MAGNIVKWWRHKILGGYKHFSVLQECSTDSEELIYPGRAPSSCSAPPDLLLPGGDHEYHHHHHHNCHQQQGTIKTTTAPATNGNNQRNNKSPMRMMNSVNGDVIIVNGINMNGQTKEQQLTVKGGGGGGGCGKNTTTGAGGVKLSSDGVSGNSNNNHESNGGGAGTNYKTEQDRVRLEELTCDVSVENGKTPQPVQFSFTLYDVDGHGKITKDDIAGIVSTIYESFGKTVVVPHYGSKTINVRLTVSPDGKTKTTTKATTSSSVPTPKKTTIITPRRRYRPRKILTDDEGSDTSNEHPPRINVALNNSHNISNNNNNNNNNKILATHRYRQHHHNSQHNNNNTTKNTNNPANRLNKDCTANSQDETDFLHEIPTNNDKILLIDNDNDNLYESVTNLKLINYPKDTATHKNCCNIENNKVLTSQNLNICELQIKESLHDKLKHSPPPPPTTTPLATTPCRTCYVMPTHGQPTQPPQQLNNVDNTVGSNNNHSPDNQFLNYYHHLKNNHGRKKLHGRKSRSRKQKNHDEQEPISRVRSLSVGSEKFIDRITEKQECWKNAVQRDVLIEIIRDTMEKNRFCFQPNRKTVNSPSSNRSRSNTIAKMNIDEHNLINQNLNEQTPNNLAITTSSPANATTTHHNLCGYDSFLHATICTNNKIINSLNGGTKPNLIITPINSNFNNGQPQLRQYHNRVVKMRSKSHEVSSRGIQAINYHRLQTPIKLNTAALNQLNPILSHDQRMSRTINNVEKWLNEREPITRNNKTTILTASTAVATTNDLNIKIAKDNDLIKTTNTNSINNYNEKHNFINFIKKGRLIRSKSKEELCIRDKQHQQQSTTTVPLIGTIATPAVIPTGTTATNDLLFDKLKITENVTSGSCGESNRKSQQQLSSILHLNNKKQQQQKLKIDLNDISNKNIKSNLTTMEYASIPVTGEPIECENLLKTSDDDINEIINSGKSDGDNTPGTPTVHRYVHEHIHHHYHHYLSQKEEI